MGEEELQRIREWADSRDCPAPMRYLLIALLDELERVRGCLQHALARADASERARDRLERERRESSEGGQRP